MRLDERQQAVLDSRARVLRVLGGPGSGKSTLAVELVVDAVQRQGLRADACLVITSSRSAAAELRQQVTARLGGTSTESLARTWQAFGFGVLRAEAALGGEPPPRLLNGPEQDVILRDLLAGHASGEVPGPQWPDGLGEALRTRGFRNELRDLLMRTVEHGLGPDDLARLGAEHDRPEWVAAAQVLREYDQVTSFSRHGSYDPAWVLTAAAELLDDDPGALDRLHERIGLVVVDEAQELTSAAARLLRVVARSGPRIVLLGDPDVAVQTFRGADPRFLASGWTDLGEVTRSPYALGDEPTLLDFIEPDVPVGRRPTGGARRWCSTAATASAPRSPRSPTGSRGASVRSAAVSSGAWRPSWRRPDAARSRSPSCAPRPRRPPTSRRC